MVHYNNTQNKVLALSFVFLLWTLQQISFHQHAFALITPFFLLCSTCIQYSLFLSVLFFFTGRKPNGIEAKYPSFDEIIYVPFTRNQRSIIIHDIIASGWSLRHGINRSCPWTQMPQRGIDILHFCYVFPTWSIELSFDSSGRYIDTPKTVCLPQFQSSYPLARLYNMPKDATLLLYIVVTTCAQTAVSPHMHRGMLWKLRDRKYFSYTVMQCQRSGVVWLECYLSIMPFPQWLVDEGIDGYVAKMSLCRTRMDGSTKKTLVERALPQDLPRISACRYFAFQELCNSNRP